MARSDQSGSTPQVRASQLLKVPSVWVLPAATLSVVVFLISLIYVGSFVDPLGQLHGLPVLVVNDDRGATVGTTRLDLGQQVVGGLTHSSQVTRRLSLAVVPLADATATMDIGGAYATVVIPPTFTRSLVALAGVVPLAPGTPAQATITLLTNQRLGSIGTGLAGGVIQPAVAAISHRVGRTLLSASRPVNRANPILRAKITDPIALATVIYRPLPPHSALGLSAFYIALLALMCGFLGATTVNATIDAALGFGTSDVGPRWQQRIPVSISRWQTLLAKWGVAVVLSPLFTGLLLLVAIGIVHMDAPSVGYLWLFTSLAAITVAVGTLTLCAVLGTLGQLVAILVFLYLGLASWGGTVPLQAIPGVFQVVAQVEPLRQIVDGVRAILFFGAQGQAGLTHALVVVGIDLVFGVIVGALVTTWYDRRGLHRMQSDILAYVTRSVRAYGSTRADQPASGPAVDPDR